MLPSYLNRTGAALLGRPRAGLGRAATGRRACFPLLPAAVSKTLSTLRPTLKIRRRGTPLDRCGFGDAFKNV